VKVVLRVSGHIAEYFPSGAEALELELEESLPVSAILGRIGVAPGLVMAVLVNGRRQPLSYVPSDGEELTLVAPPAGG
jgi:hypothetical protein